MYEKEKCLLSVKQEAAKFIMAGNNAICMNKMYTTQTQTMKKEHGQSMETFKAATHNTMNHVKSVLKSLFAM